MTVQCAHVDVTLYPLAEVQVEVRGVVSNVRAAVAERLPVSVLLRMYVPKMRKRLQLDPRAVCSEGLEEAE